MVLELLISSSAPIGAYTFALETSLRCSLQNLINCHKTLRRHSTRNRFKTGANLMWSNDRHWGTQSTFYSTHIVQVIELTVLNVMMRMTLSICSLLVIYLKGWQENKISWHHKRQIRKTSAWIGVVAFKALLVSNVWKPVALYGGGAERVNMGFCPYNKRWTVVFGLDFVLIFGYHPLNKIWIGEFVFSYNPCNTRWSGVYGSRGPTGRVSAQWHWKDLHWHTQVSVYITKVFSFKNISYNKGIWL